MKNLAKILPVIALSFPTVAFAQGRILFLVQDLRFIIDLLIVVVGGIALLVFFWGLVKFIYSASAEGKSEGKGFMLWGVVALFVMVSVWGLVNFIQRELLPGTDFGDPRLPGIPRR